MSHPSIPAEARAFLREHVESLIELEIVLLLRRAKERTLSIASIAAELFVERDILEPYLERLSIKNLVDVKIGEDIFYRLGPLANERSAALDVLAAIYAQRRLAIADLIEARDPNPALDFADAFRLRPRSKPAKAPKGKK